MSRKRKQLSLDVKYYVVTWSNGAFEIQAPSASAAKYEAFKRVRDIGYCRYDGGFLAFAAGGVSVRELRQ